MSFCIFENQRKQLQAFKTVDHLNESIRAYMYKYKREFHNSNTHYKELNAVGKVFKVIYKHSVKTAGVSFLSNKSIASMTDLSIRSVKRATRVLQELEIILKVHTKRSNGSDTSNTIIIKPLLSSIVDKLFNRGDNPCHPPFAPLEAISFNQEKQERDNNINNPIKEKIALYIENRVNDAIKKGTTIKYLSSYIDRAFRSLEKQALYDENIRQAKQRKQFEREQAEQLHQTLNIKREPVIYYNWLEK